MNPSAESRKPRTRSPAYPSIDLRTAVERAGVLWREEGRHPTAVNVAMTHWGYKAESSTGFQTVAALKKFNLVESEGGTGEDRLIKLSPVALTILQEDDAPPAERQAALRTAALGPRIHAELWDRFGTELPSAPSLRRFLVVEKSFNESVVDHLIEEYRATVAFARLGTPTVAAPATPRGEGSSPVTAMPRAVVDRPAPAPAWSSPFVTRSAPRGRPRPACLLRRPRPRKLGPVPGERRRSRLARCHPPRRFRGNSQPVRRASSRCPWTATRSSACPTR